MMNKDQHPGEKQRGRFSADYFDYIFAFSFLMAC